MRMFGRGGSVHFNRYGDSNYAHDFLGTFPVRFFIIIIIALSQSSMEENIWL